MKKNLAILGLVLCVHCACMASCPDQIKAFYRAYLSNLLHDDTGNAALCKVYLTEELIDKMHRVGNATDGDPIIRAQDTNEDALETLRVEALGDDWYLVKYQWKKEDDQTVVEIPLKARDIEGQCKIFYITPIWNGARYGDELLTSQGPRMDCINQTSARSFLESFYDTYTALYCAMPKDLGERLSLLRLKYLSSRALKQYGDAETENLLDGADGYDLLIGNFDFDCTWRRSLAFDHLSGDNYQITYRGGDKAYKIIVTLKKENDRFVIDRLK